MPESTTQKKGQKRRQFFRVFFCVSLCTCWQVCGALASYPPEVLERRLSTTCVFVCVLCWLCDTSRSLSPTPHRRKHLQHGMARIAGGCGAGVDAKADIDVVAVFAAVLVVVVALAMSSLLPSARHSVFGTGRGIHTYVHIHIYTRLFRAKLCVFGCVGNVFWCARSRSVGGGAHSSICLYVFVGSLHPYTLGQSCVSAAM